MGEGSRAGVPRWQPGSIPVRSGSTRFLTCRPTFLSVAPSNRAIGTELGQEGLEAFTQSQDHQHGEVAFGIRLACEGPIFAHASIGKIDRGNGRRGLPERRISGHPYLDGARSPAVRDGLRHRHESETGVSPTAVHRRAPIRRGQAGPPHGTGRRLALHGNEGRKQSRVGSQKDN